MERIKSRIKKAKKGFTLIEIIVVLVIIAIMAAIAVPAVTGYINDAKNSKYVADARSIYLMVQAEETKYLADEKDADYGAIATTVENDAGMKSAGITDVTITKAGTTYTITFSDNGTAKTATVEKNKTVTIAD